MLGRSRITRHWLWPLAAVGLLFSAGLAHAQAWVPAPGEGSVSLSYQYTHISKHLFSVDLDGYVDPTGYVGGPDNSMYMGDVVGHSGVFGFDLGLVRTLALSGWVVGVTNRYRGLSGEGPQDDGQFHATLQDAQIALRAMIPWLGFAITPSIGARIPVGNYESFGHVAAGRGLNEVQPGVAIGRSLDPFLPDAFFQASYTRALVESVEEFSLDQNRFGFDLGYFVTPDLSVRGTFGYRDTKDGVDWAWDLATPSGFAEHWEHHDIAAKEFLRLVGGSVGYSMGDRLGIGISYVGTVSGSNSHQANSMTVSTSWNVQGPWAQR